MLQGNRKNNNSSQKEKILKIGKRFDEVINFMDEVGEKKIKEILDNEGKDKLVFSFFNQWEILLKHYIESSEKNKTLSDIHDIILLLVLLEGFVKIICFYENPSIILSRKKKNRTLGNIKYEFEKILSKKENDEIKILELKKILNLFTKLRNEFLHFPFYYELDYRFSWLFFQLVAYTLEKLDLWKYLDEDTRKVIKCYAENEPSGISLLEVPLYDKRKNTIQ